MLKKSILLSSESIIKGQLSMFGHKNETVKGLTDMIINDFMTSISIAIISLFVIYLKV